MEVAFEVFHIFYKEIKKILAIGPVSEQNGEFIRFFILCLDSPKMVESFDYPHKLHTI